MTCRDLHWDLFPRPWWLRRAVLPVLAGVFAFAVCVVARPAGAADLEAAQQLYDSGHYAEAATAAAVAIQAREWGDAWPLLKLRAELAVGHYAEALATFDAALAQHSGSVALRLAAREAYLYNNQPEKAQEQLAIIQALAQQSPWRYSDPANRVLLGRTLLLTGADPRQVLELLYNKARVERPEELDAYLASAELALDKSDDALAAETLAKAARLAPRNPQVHYLLARALESGDDRQSSAALDRALELNPRHVPSLLLRVEDRLDAEDHAAAEALLVQACEVNPREPLAWAYRALLAHLAGKRDEEKQHRAKALEPWATNPAVDHLIGRRLARAYRFAEAAEYQRQALARDPLFTPAKIQLAQDLLRAGHEDEGWRLAAEAFDHDAYNVVAHNLTTLHETLARYRTLEAPGFVLRMEAAEAELYGPRALALLQRARDTLCAKYECELREPVIVEVFREQKDFAIRTFGLPGGAGFLGVCFGRVVTANSPASQGEHPANWESVLWHEFCHVVTLTKTRNKMPRWLSEGISVYEERQQNPAWGQSLDPESRAMLLGDELTPVSRLSQAFLKPRSPAHLMFAYYESSLVVEYIVERYGLVALRRMLTDLANDVPIGEALARHTEPLAQLDAEFATHVRSLAEAFAPGTDWSELDLPDDATADMLAEFNQEHPRHYAGLQRAAQRFAADKQWKAALPVLDALLAIHPPQALPLLAQAHRALGDTTAERQSLEKLAALESNATDAYLRLMELGEQAGDWAAVEQNAQRMLAVNPLVVAPYRHLARAADKLQRVDAAIEARQALLRLDPSDPAAAHYELARLWRTKGDLARARRHVLQSLEEAPRYRDAQRLLLEWVDQPTEKKP